MCGLMEDIKMLTPEGGKKLKEELSALKERRKVVMEKVKFARSLGDLSENDEYSSARDEQAFVDGKIKMIEATLKVAKVVKKDDGNKVVSLGCTVSIASNGDKTEFNLVGATEADPLNGKISCESPLGVALLAKKVGDRIDFEAPVGKVTYTILEVR